MSIWPLGDSSRAVSAQSRELLKSWDDEESVVEEPGKTAAGNWAVRNGILADLQRGNVVATTELPCIDLQVTTIVPEMTRPVDATLMQQRIELPSERTESAFNKYAPVKDTSVSPLTRVNQILEENSDSSRWLNQRGYLEAFKSPNCMLDISFSTADKNVLKVGAVMSAPDGSKRTVVACDDGTTFQRITGPGGQEIVKFLSNGQIVEFGNDMKRSGEFRKLTRTGEFARPTRTGELSIFK